ncbi:uncharacterized protein LOC131893644 [Tigriopus californicus]|uniref:uncharacterized protein LOC131893644 n=1 Tax=Tigriopus californicus TaxID=6832 RepID=UPI0027DA1FDB|nr:uncharacterized protein LOC131893644 [Tigriopus californicus]
MERRCGTLCSIFWTVLIQSVKCQFHDPAQIQPGCEFPDKWEGGWFLINERDPLMVSKDELGILGICFQAVESANDQQQFILFERIQKCYRCITIQERHENVLQFRMSTCEPPSQVLSEPEVDPQKLCQMIPPDEPFSTLVRLSGEDSPCPFDGEYSFTYSMGQQQCQQKSRSQLTSCMTSDQVAFKFLPCHGGPGMGQDPSAAWNQMESNVSISKVETLTCKGHWSEDERTFFLIGILDIPYVTKLSERIRCFIYRQSPNGAIQMGQSGDASCQGLHRVRDGVRTMAMKRVIPPTDRSECQFPDWASTVGSFHSFSFSSQYEFTEDRTTMIMSNYSYILQEAHQISKTACVEIVETPTSIDELNGGVGNNHNNRNAFRQSQVSDGQTETEKFLDEPEAHSDYVKMVTKVTAGCETMFKCMSLYKRSENILEIQEGRLTRTLPEACTYHNMNEEMLSFTMLIRTEAENVPCTADGYHNVTSLDLKGQTDPCGSRAGFREVLIQCGESNEEIEFIRDCDGQEKNSVFHCLGGWEEEIPYESLPNSNPTAGSNVFNPFPRSSEFKPYGGFKSMISDYEFDEELPDNVTLGYMVARPQIEDSNSPKRVCFIYTYYNDTYFWTVDTTTCLRNIRPGEVGKFRFNTTKIESCNALSVLFENSPLILAALVMVVLQVNQPWD